MRQADVQMVRTKAFSIRESVKIIREYAQLPDEEFWADVRNMFTIKLHLIQAVEDTANLCSHLSARLGGVAPANYASCFESLVKLNILEQNLGERLQKMSRFRNLLVHRYWEVDDRRVLELARHEVQDLEAFVQAVGQHLSLAL